MSYQPQSSCTRCSGRAMPGTVALLAYLMQRFPQTGSLGIYNCRNVAGSSTMSQHSCGRAADSRIPTSGGAPIPSIGNQVVQFLHQFSTEFGIAQQIYNRVIYDAKTPSGRYYGGVHPHYDHVHWVQTPAKALSLTYAEIVSIAGGSGSGGGSIGGYDDMLGFDIGRLGTPALPFSERGASLQLMLNDRGAKLGVDGVCGDATRQALIAFQKAHGIGAPEQGSGQIGAYTNAALYKPTASSGGGVSIAQVNAAVAAHERKTASTAVHPHRHSEGTTGQPIA